MGLTHIENSAQSCKVGLGALFGRMVSQVTPLMELSTTRRGGRSADRTTPNFPTGIRRIQPSDSSASSSSSTMSALSIADCQADSQCWSGISAGLEVLGGRRTRRAGMGVPMPRSTPEWSTSENSASGSELMSDSACHKFRRNGWPASISRSLVQTAWSRSAASHASPKKRG